MLTTGVVGKDLDDAALPVVVVGVERFDVKESEDWRSAVCIFVCDGSSEVTEVGEAVWW